jgi:hypothetical protein
MRKKYTDKFFRPIDPHKNFAWHLLPSTGKSGGILCGIKKEKFEIIRVGEKEFLIAVEVQDKSLKKNRMLIMVYGPAHEDRRDTFLTELAETCQKLKFPP